MDEFLKQFPEAEFTQVGPHQVPLTLTPLSAIPSPRKAFFPAPKGVLLLEGKDRETFMQGMVTSDLKPWEQGKGYRTLLASSKGKVQFDLQLLKLEDKMLLVTEPGEELRMLNLFDFYLIREEVTVTNVSQDYKQLYLCREEEGDFPALEGWEMQLSEDPRLQGMLVPAESAFLAPLAEEGFSAIGLRDFDEMRPLYGLVRWGKDFNENIFPKEASLNSCVSYHKGCFMGQEPIARMHNRGKPQKMLKVFVSSAVLKEGDLILGEEKELGWITTSSTLVAEKGFLSMGYVKTKWLDGNREVPLKVGETEIKLKN